jgi:drug/metabolite transporter (DMT)-like permease
MKGYLAALAAFSIWAVNCTVLLRHIPLPGPVVTHGGFAMSAICLGAYLVLSGRSKETWAALVAHRWRLIAVSVMFAGCSVTYQWAIKTTTVANAALTHYFTPILTVAIFEPVFLKTKATKFGVLALVLGFGGLLVLLLPQLSLDGPIFGLVMGTASALFFAVFNILVPPMKDMMKREVLLFWSLALSTIMLVPLTAGMRPMDLLGPALPRAIVFGLINYLLTNLLYYYALVRISPGRLTTLGYIEPAIAIAAGAAFLGEPVTSYALAGGALILISGLLTVFGDRKTE